MGCLSIQTSPLTCSSTKTFISLVKYWTSKSLPPTTPNPFASPNKNDNSWTLKACPYDWNTKITWKLAPSKPPGTKTANIGYLDPSTKTTYPQPLPSTLSWNQDPIKPTNHTTQAYPYNTYTGNIQTAHPKKRESKSAYAPTPEDPTATSYGLAHLKHKQIITPIN